MSRHTAVDNEKELCRRIKSHDKTAIKKLYTTYIGYLSAVCFRYITDDDDAKDVLQDCFIKIITKFPQFEYRGEGSLKAWMIRILINEAIDFIKNKEKDRILEYNSEIPDTGEEQEPNVEDVPTDVIHNMIKNLSVGYRTVFNLYVFENKSHKQIAEILDIKESSSASQYLRAKRLLAKWINNYRKTGKEDYR